MHSLYHTIGKKENNQLQTETTGMANAKKNTETLRKVSRWRENKQQVVASFVAVFFFFLTWLNLLYEKQTNEILYRILLWNMKNFNICCRLKCYLNVKFSKHDKYEK